MPNTFPKNSKLCGQLRIARLYKEGKRFVAWPLRVTYMQVQPAMANGQQLIANSQILVWAPKSLFKHAVDRNHLRRLMREAYRKNQHLLGEQHYQIAFNYMDKEIQSYQTIEKAICKALKKVKNEN
ncbi:MAG: ribonuclease P protein component [Paludibacteraceae bacterium]|nr:ribonuclease P protein component [Paludibacteraceae bacterium]